MAFGVEIVDRCFDQGKEHSDRFMRNWTIGNSCYERINRRVKRTRNKSLQLWRISSIDNGTNNITDRGNLIRSE